MNYNTKTSKTCNSSRIEKWYKKAIQRKCQGEQKKSERMRLISFDQDAGISSME